MFSWPVTAISKEYLFICFKIEQEFKKKKKKKKKGHDYKPHLKASKVEVSNVYRTQKAQTYKVTDGNKHMLTALVRTVL